MRPLGGEIGNQYLFVKVQFQLVEDKPTAGPAPTAAVRTDKLTPRYDVAFTCRGVGRGATTRLPSIIWPTTFCGNASKSA